MSKVEIFDPAMCCSTGVCGPGVDPELLRMAAVVSSLQKAGKEIVRHNLAEEPEVYVKNAAVNQALMKDGVSVLPITLVDGKLVKSGRYPSNEELLRWTGAAAQELENLQTDSGCSDTNCCCG